MISLGIRHIKPDQRDQLKAWLRELDGSRREEALRTLADEGVQHEKAVLLDTSDGPILVYAMESPDPDRARAVAAASGREMDRTHREILQAADGGRPDIEVLLDLHLG